MQQKSTTKAEWRNLFLWLLAFLLLSISLFYGSAKKGNLLREVAFIAVGIAFGIISIWSFVSLWAWTQAKDDSLPFEALQEFRTRLYGSFLFRYSASTVFVCLAVAMYEITKSNLSVIPLLPAAVLAAELTWFLLLVFGCFWAYKSFAENSIATAIIIGAVTIALAVGANRRRP